MNETPQVTVDAGWLANEPKVTINGTTLTPVQAMVLRVAVSSFHMELCSDETTKALGEALAAGYKMNTRYIQMLMVTPSTKESG